MTKLVLPCLVSGRRVRRLRRRRRRRDQRRDWRWRPRRRRRRRRRRKRRRRRRPKNSESSEYSALKENAKAAAASKKGGGVCDQRSNARRVSGGERERRKRAVRGKAEQSRAERRQWESCLLSRASIIYRRPPAPAPAPVPFQSFPGDRGGHLYWHLCVVSSQLQPTSCQQLHCSLSFIQFIHCLKTSRLLLTTSAAKPFMQIRSKRKNSEAKCSFTTTTVVIFIFSSFFSAS